MMDEIDMYIKEMPHGAKVTLWIVNIMESLIDKGLMEGPIEMTDTGREALRRLEADGFEPTDDEIRAAMLSMAEAGVLELPPGDWPGMMYAGHSLN